jgi:hypothetical protein
MTKSAETRLDGHTLVVRILMRFQRCSGRMRIVAPDGCEIGPTSRPRRTARWPRPSAGALRSPADRS